MPSQLSNRELLLRGAVTADDTSLVDLTAAHAKKGAAIEMDYGLEDVQLFFFGTDAENETATLTLWGWSRGSGNPTYRLGSWTLTLGTAVCSALPWDSSTAVTSGFYVDTIVEVDNQWEVDLFDNGGDDRVSWLGFYLRGLAFLYPEWTNVGTGGEAASIYAGYRAY